MACSTTFARKITLTISDPESALLMIDQACTLDRHVTTPEHIMGFQCSITNFGIVDEAQPAECAFTEHTNLVFLPCERSCSSMNCYGIKFDTFKGL